MNFNIDLINILIFLIILINSLYGIVIYIRNRQNVTNCSFFILTISISLWCLSMFFYRGFQNHELVLAMSRLLYFTAITIPTAFIFFVVNFPNKGSGVPFFKKFFILLPMFILCTLSIIPDLFINDILLVSNHETIIAFNQISHLSFGIYVIIYFIWAYLILVKKYKKFGGEIRKQLVYIFIGTICSTTVTLITNLSLLYFNIFEFNWMGQISVIVMISFIFYSISHNKLFDIRFISAQIITFTLWIFIGLRILFAKTIREVVVESSLLLITIIFGILLIRSAINEINRRKQIDSHREQLRILNASLAQKVAEQTMDIKLAYDLETKARRDLEKLNETKDQFIMITQHNLRTPVTNMRYRLELLEKQLTQSGDKAKFEILKNLNDTQISIENLTRIVDDFLNITTLKVGSQILNTEITSIKPILDKVINELKIDIEQRNITINNSNENNVWPNIRIDSNKIFEVLTIVIENAIRYNFDNGQITISTLQENNIYKIIIENTGVGMASDEKNNIFERLFYRSKKARSANPRGMGIGLTVSRAIMRAHHGEIYLNSKGENQGATVTMELPIDFMANFQ